MDQFDFALGGMQTPLEKDGEPQPLRITKRQKQPVTNIASRQPLMADDSVYTNQSEPIPTKNASFNQSQTQTSLTQRSSTTTSSSRSSYGTSDLKVRKHRAATSQANPATLRSLVGIFHGNALRDCQTTRIKKNDRFMENKANINKNKGPSRAVTTGFIPHKEQLDLFNDGPLFPVAPRRLVPWNRPMAMTSDGPHETTEFEALGQYSGQDISRHNKPRLVSRVINEFASKYNAVTGRDGNVSVPSEAAGTRKETLNQSHSVGLNEQDILSPSKTSNREKRLENTLASFPSPPPSQFSSPTKSSCGDLKLKGPEVRGSPLVAEHVAVASAEISAVAEIDRLSLDDGQSIFVAVEIKGTLNTPENRPRELNGLDVVVIIDNSMFASPTTLMAGCETARHIASLLDMKNDRMAIVATSPLRPNGPHSKTILGLYEINLRRVKMAVDSIVGSFERPELIAALNRADDILTDPTDANQVKEHGQGYFGHIFLITPNCSGVSQEFLHHRRLHIHVVCPGSIPWRSHVSIDNNGWVLRSMYRSELECVSPKKDADDTCLFNDLRSVILQARGGIMSGKLTDLVLEIGAGTDCSIEGVIGPKKFSSLRPGETITAVVKVKVGLSSPWTDSVCAVMQRQSLLLDSTDLLEEIHVMLGSSSFTILTAKLRYHHSLFPPGTSCSIMAESNIKKKLPGSTWNKNPSKLETLQASEIRTWVQKRLVFNLATHQSPENALSTLKTYFGDAGDRSVCPRYIKLVMDELKYQVRVFDRLESLKISEGIFEDNSVSDGSYEHFGNKLFEVTDFKPLDWSFDSLDGSDNPDTDSDEPNFASSYVLMFTSDEDPSSKNPWEKNWMRNTLIQDTFSDNNTVVEGDSRHILDASSSKEAMSSGNSSKGLRSGVANILRQKHGPFHNIGVKLKSHKRESPSSRKNIMRDGSSSSQHQLPYGRSGARQGMVQNEPKPRNLSSRELRRLKSKENIRSFHESSSTIHNDHYRESRRGALQYWADQAVAKGRQVIIVKNEEERIKLTRELDLADQRSRAAEAMGSGANRSRPGVERTWWAPNQWEAGL